MPYDAAIPPGGAASRSALVFDVITRWKVYAP